MILAFYFLNHSYWFNIGEREQLFVIFFFPLLILRSLRCIYSSEIPNWLAITSGAYASLGILLKPQFLLCVLGFEVVLYFTNKPLYKLRCAEFAAMLSCSGIYLLLLCLMPLDAWRTYFSEILPVYISGFEWSKKPLITLLTGGIHIKFAIGVFCFSSVVSLFLIKQHKLIIPLLAFMFISMLNYLYGGQVWIYRIFPVQAGAFLVLGLAIGVGFDKLSNRSWYNQMWFSGSVLISIISIASFIQARFQENQEILPAR